METVNKIFSLITNFNVILIVFLFMFGTVCRRRKYAIITASAGGAVYFAIPAIYLFVTGQSFWRCPWFYINGTYNTIFVIYWIFAMALFFGVFEVKLLDTLFFGAAAYSAQNFAFNFSISVTSLIRSWTPVNVWVNMFLRVALYAGLFALFYYLFVKRVKQSGENMIKNVSLIVFVTVSLLIINVFSQVWIRAVQQGAGRGNFSGIFAWICALLLLVIQFGLFEKSQLKREKAVLAEIVAEAGRRQQMAKDNIDVINRKCHDLKHQIKLMRSLSEKEQEKFLDDLEQSVMLYDDIAKTGNEAIDVLLTEKSIICQKHDIRFTYMLDGKAFDFMDKVDAYTLLSNALENAIESVCRLDDKAKRIISMRTGGIDGIMQFELENYCESPVVFENGLPVTDKDDKELHGYGVKSIKAIAEKYNGTAYFNLVDNRFTLKILFTV